MSSISAKCHLLWFIIAAGLAPTGEANATGPRVLLETNKGDIVLELYPDKAPRSVENFLTYARDGFYDGTVFHRVISNFMIQGGGLTTNYKPKQTRAPIHNEADNGLKNKRGTIAMARTADPHSATAQFFINVVDNPSLDHTAPTINGWGYAVFGTVVEGMDTVDRIRMVATGAHGPLRSDVPQTPVIIRRVIEVELAPADGGGKEAGGE